MTNPTDPRVEAAARALCSADGYNPSGDSITPVNNPEMDVNWKVYAPDAEIALKAADKAAWNTNIKEAPGSRQTIMVQLKSGRVTHANNEFPQGEDGWVDLLWGQDIPESEIVAWRLVPHYTNPQGK